MKANELRIGNYVIANKDEVIVAGFVGFYVSYIPIEKYHAYADMIHHIKPIPLTEEWLLKLGFEQCFINKERYHIDNLNEVEFIDNEIRWMANYTTFYHQKIEFVHQLQNLYFALTNTELKTT